VFRFTSEDCDQFFLCIKMSNGLAEQLADMGEYPVQLSLHALEDLHIKISDKSEVVPAFVDYDTGIRKKGWLKPQDSPGDSDADAVLRPVDKMRLLYDKIIDYIDIHDLERLGFITAFFADHNKSVLLPVKKRWANFYYVFMPTQPIDEIRDYFGEGVAFYFLFLAFIVRGLLFLMIPGTLCSLGWWFEDCKVMSQIVFTILLLIWSILILKFWKRREAYYVNKWGMCRHDSASHIKEPLNPHFHGKKLPSKLDENMKVLEAEPTKRFVGYIVSVTVSALFTCLILAGVAANRYWAAHTSAAHALYPALALSLQIQLGDKIWDLLLVDRLSGFEQHVTLYSFDQSRVAKSFVIKFLNGTVAFLYIAYIQPLSKDGRDACKGDCTSYLRYQLMIVFLTYVTFGFMDLGLPLVQVKLSAWWAERNAEKHGRKHFALSLLEQQAVMLAHTGADEQDGYLSVVLPLAFILMFGAILPCMVFLAFLALACQLRAHALKVSGVVRRTFPTRAEGIGTWDTIIRCLFYVANFNSTGMLVVHVGNLGEYVPGFAYIAKSMGTPIDSLSANVVLFFILQNAGILLRLLLDAVVDDEDQQTKLEKARQDLQRGRFMEQREEHSGFHESVELVCHGDLQVSNFENVPPLEPGCALYVSPIV